MHSHQPSTDFSHYQPFSFPIRSAANLTQTTDLFLTYQLTMALYVEMSWCLYQLFHRIFTIDLTASIVSCQSCVVYITFVGNSVLSFTTSELNYKQSCSGVYLQWATTWQTRPAYLGFALTEVFAWISKPLGQPLPTDTVYLFNAYVGLTGLFFFIFFFSNPVSISFKQFKYHNKICEYFVGVTMGLNTTCCFRLFFFFSLGMCL